MWKNLMHNLVEFGHALTDSPDAGPSDNLCSLCGHATCEHRNFRVI